MLLNSSLALVTKILQIILRDLIYFINKFFFLVDRLSARGWQLNTVLPVICDILRLCIEYFTNGTVYCKVKRFDL